MATLLERADAKIKELREKGEIERADALAESVRKIRDALGEDEEIVVV
jgi:hypothetical protein